MSGALQLGFSDYEQVYAKKKTRRQIFLDEMEATILADRHNCETRCERMGLS